MARTVEFAQSANVFACCAMVPPASAISLSGLDADTDTVYLSQSTSKDASCTRASHFDPAMRLLPSMPVYQVTPAHTVGVVVAEVVRNLVEL